MSLEYFLFIDSGIGGISTLAHVSKLSNANYIYYADNKHCPYGSHSKEDVFGFLKEIILKIQKKHHLKAVILACNTATTTSIDQLRQRFPDIIFIGTEPAIKLASKMKFKNVLCLVTPSTAGQEKYLKLKKTCVDSKITTFSPKNLALKIENFSCDNSYFNLCMLLRDLFSILKKCQNHKFDCIVLGCTHYALIKDIIAKFTTLPLIDGNNGVANRIKHLSFNKNNGIMPHVAFKFSLRKSNLTQKYKKCYNKHLQII